MAATSVLDKTTPPQALGSSTCSTHPSIKLSFGKGGAREQGSKLLFRPGLLLVLLTHLSLLSEWKLALGNIYFIHIFARFYKFYWHKLGNLLSARFFNESAFLPAWNFKLESLSIMDQCPYPWTLIPIFKFSSSSVVNRSLFVTNVGQVSILFCWFLLLYGEAFTILLWRCFKVLLTLLINSFIRNGVFY